MEGPRLRSKSIIRRRFLIECQGGTVIFYCGRAYSKTIKSWTKEKLEAGGFVSILEITYIPPLASDLRFLSNEV